MAEENQVEGQSGQAQVPNNEPAEGAQSSAPATPQYNDTERRAMAQGWVPEDQYSGSGKWRSAEEFLDRGELFSKIDEQNRKLRAAEQTLDALKIHHRRVAETEYRRAVASLKAEKKAALDEGNNERVVQIDDELVQVREQANQTIRQIEVQQQVAPGPDPAFVAWTNRNQWYKTDRAMKIFADTIGDDLVADGVRNPQKVLEEVEKRVKQEFPHKFNNPNRTKAGSVEGGGSQGSQSGKSFQLTAEETQVMNKFVKAGVMTRDEYITEIKAMRKEAE